MQLRVSADSAPDYDTLVSVFEIMIIIIYLFLKVIENLQTPQIPQASRF